MKRTKLEMEEIYADTENHLLRLRSHSRVRKVLAEKHSVSNRQVQNWITEVHRRWKEAAGDEDKETKRNETRALLNELISICMNKVEPVRGVDGKTLFDPTTGKPVLRARPDVQRALHAVAQLRALDGLDLPTKVDVNHSGGTKDEVTHTVTPKTKEALVTALKGLKRPAG